MSFCMYIHQQTVTQINKQTNKHISNYILGKNNNKTINNINSKHKHTPR